MDRATRHRPVTWVGPSRHEFASTNAYRAVYTVQFTEAIYVLHAFKKKSTKGIATPKREIDLIRRRLADAERLHRERQP